MYFKLVVLTTVLFAAGSADPGSTNQWPGRSTIVHLFEWKWTDIAEECERFLGPKGFGGVQVSPPSENLIIHNNGARPWYERYQVMSYKLKTRSGNQREFVNMTRRCNKVGVRIYVDVVVNHMTGDNSNNVGTAGSTADFQQYDYPAVPYRKEHFHYPFCGIEDYNNAAEVRNCQLVGLKDLNQSQDYVRDQIVNYFNKLIDLGVAGLRVDAAKHMWPTDLREIYKRLSNLNPDFFKPNSRPYIYQEVIYNGGGEAIKPSEYTSLGAVTEFRAAVAFMLAHPYGEPRVMSSYFFSNNEQGPPSDHQENILSPIIYENDTCGNGWVCEHRWRQIYQMVGFRNAAGTAPVLNWWDNGNNQIAFSRGDKAFIVFNLEGRDLNETLQTGLPAGEYCDVITGKREHGKCSGSRVTVDIYGLATLHLPADAEDMHLAIHVGPQSSLKRSAAPAA